MKIPQQAEISLMGRLSNDLVTGRKTPVPWFIVDAGRIAPGVAEVEVELSSMIT